MIEYDTYLNKVKKVNWADGRWISFTYNGASELIQRKNLIGDTWDYANGIIYKNNVAYQIPTSEGRIVNNAGTWAYEYEYRDIMKNMRVVFKKEANQLKITQISDFDAFGFELASISGSITPQNFKYQGQEKVSDFGLNWDLFKFRPSDGQLGRFFQIDVLSETYPFNSVYALQENKFGKGVELEGTELKEFGEWLGKKVDQALSWTDVDDVTVVVTNITRGGNAVHVDGKPATGSDKIFAAGGLLLPVVSGTAVKKIGGAVIDKVKDAFKIDISEANKVNRKLLDPPTKPGNAPTFKKDGTPVEIHHEGQNAKGPFKEMHSENHRKGENYKKNHPTGSKPLTKEERKEFNKARGEYWKKEFSKE